MDPARFARLREIVRAAATLPVGERAAFLDGECAADADLRLDAERLLRYEADDTRLPETGPSTSPLLAEPAPRAAPLPDRIGPYRILGLLGEGGMGTVYRAEQVEPIRREVALKLIRHGADSAAVLARFESERQTLALMDHPNVARVLDAGADKAGRPYFVMELIRGVPVTAYCDSHGLGARERLRLFLDVCRGVRHAHRKGVIHRDLKPSNVLVAESGARPVPRVIDFSIAKSLGEPAIETEFLTRTGQVVGTLEYMSPEQARGDAARLDTRSDVYSLGVLAYKLLTGRLPHEVRDVPLHEAVRRIAEMPPRPLRTVGTTTTTGRIDADVETIVGKCLEKEPERRYGTAGELVEDLERYFDARPILARPPSATYAIRMLVKRRRGAVAAAVALLFALAAGAVGTGFGFVRARTEAANARTEAAIAEAVNKFLNEDLLAASNPGQRGADVTVREVLDVAAERLEGKFPDQPLVEAALRVTIGQSWSTIGEYRRAEEQLKLAVEIERAVAGEPRPQLYDTLNALGWALQFLGRYDEAFDVLQEAVTGLQDRLGAEHPDTLRAMNNLGVVYWRRALHEEAEAIHREALEIKLRTIGESDEATLATKTNLAIVLITLGRTEEAGPLFEDVVEGRRRALGASHPNTINAMHNLAKFYVVTERAEDADALFDELVEESRRVLGDEHPRTLATLAELAKHDASRGRVDEAARNLQQVFELRMKVLGPDAAETWHSLIYLGEIYEQAGRTAEAEAALLEALEGERRAFGEDNPLRSAELLAELYRKTGRLERAEGLFRDLLDQKQRKVGAERVWTLDAMESLGEVLLARGLDAEAETLVTDLLEKRRRVLGPVHRDTVETALTLARLALEDGDAERALDLLGDLVESGWKDPRVVEAEPFSGLAGNPRFDALIAGMRDQSGT